MRRRKESIYDTNENVGAKTLHLSALQLDSRYRYQGMGIVSKCDIMNKQSTRSHLCLFNLIWLITSNRPSPDPVQPLVFSYTFLIPRPRARFLTLIQTYQDIRVHKAQLAAIQVISNLIFYVNQMVMILYSKSSSWEDAKVAFLYHFYSYLPLLYSQSSTAWSILLLPLQSVFQGVFAYQKRVYKCQKVVYEDPLQTLKTI